MSVSDDLTSIAQMCQMGAHQTLGFILSMGPKPGDPSQGMLWDQRITRLQGQLNSLSELNSKLTSAAVIQGLQQFAVEIAGVAAVSTSAEQRIKHISDVSSSLTKIAKVLDLGLAILAAAAVPSPPTIAAVLVAAEAVADGV